METKLTWSILLFCISVQVNCDPHLSKQDVALLAHEENPKCFSRNVKDLICFWESLEGKSYEFFYTTDDKEHRCHLNKLKSEDGKILHVCFFPPSDVWMFSNTYLKVVDTDTNEAVYNRSVFVEEQLLLDPPSNLSLHLTGKPGQLLVKWQEPKNSASNLLYELRYSSKALLDTFKLSKYSKREHILLSLTPGEMCTVQLRFKPTNPVFSGHWSGWSSSVTAMVPQHAVDTELQCYTPDLQQVKCRWNEGLYGEGKYSLYYKQTNRDNMENWHVCGKSNVSGMQCVLYGEESTMFQVYIRAALKPFNRIFYMGTFRMNSSIKTEPPDGLKKDIDGERLCLTWNSPLQLISKHLIYQIRYQFQGESGWKLFTVPSPKTNTCLDVQVDSQYNIQVKAIPNGSFYSGHWSDWSKCLMVQLPSNTGLLFIICVPFSLLIISVVLFSFFSRYSSKLKQILWPPVPDLNEVLESFLKDINGQHWEPNFTIKMCDEDTPASVVEIMSEGDAQVLKKSYNCSHFPQHGFLTGDNNGDYIVEGLEVNREYVTLNTGEALPCLTGNDYVYGINASSGQGGENLCCCSSVCHTAFSTSTTNILNHSYVQAGLRAQITARHYTNIDNTAKAE